MTTLPIEFNANKKKRKINFHNYSNRSNGEGFKVRVKIVF